MIKMMTSFYLTGVHGCLDLDIGLDAADDGEEGITVTPTSPEIIDSDSEWFCHLYIESRI